MSKLYSIYLNYKKQNQETILLFKSGIFYIALAEDATFLSNFFGFKLTNLNNEIKKCGFPQNSLEKYCLLFKNSNISFKIIDSLLNTAYEINEYKENEKIKEILNKIRLINLDSLSVIEAYSFIETLKKDINLIYGENNKYEKN